MSSTKRDYYDVLGISRDADAAAIIIRIPILAIRRRSRCLKM